MSGLVQWVLETQHSLSTTPVHPTYFPFAWLDVLGAIRLSVFVDQFSRQRNKVKPEEIGEKKRGTWLQECCGLLLLMFGGETLLCSCLGLTPSWMQSPNIILLFCGMHFIISRTPVHHLIPRKSNIWLEFPLSLFDALGRAMILTSFSVDLVRNTASLPSETRNNPWLMVLAAFINTVPFASLAFACHMFDKDWSFGTPGELRPGGWMMVDVWAPPVIATIYATLIRAHSTFDIPYQALRVAVLRRPMLVWAVGYETFKTRFPSSPQAWSPLEARAICAIILTVLFACRALYNFGGELNLEMMRKPTLPSLNKLLMEDAPDISSPSKKSLKKKAKRVSLNSQEL